MSDSDRVGVVLLPAGGAHGVVVRGRTVLPVELAAPRRSDVDGVIAGAAATATVIPDAVTVDISPLLLDAVIAARDLPRVAMVRILPRTTTDPTLHRSPSAVVERLVARRFSVGGGHDLLGNELRPLDRAAMAEVCRALVADGIRHVAIAAAGSQARPAHEREVADAVQAAVPGASISVASDFGGHGLATRAATVVLDCALRDLTDRLLERCERTLSRLPGRPALRIGRGDGGYSIPSRVRAMPVVALGATDALALCGAAYLADESDCRVVLTSGGARIAGEVRRGLPLVNPAELAGVGTDIVAPTAVLVPEAAVTGEDMMIDRPVLWPGRDTVTLACVGAAVSRPAAWLDEVAFIKSAAELERVRRDAVDRATAIVMANDAAPGSASMAEVSTVALPYSPAGTVRIRVRVTGEPDRAPAAARSPGGRR